eukprot:TRINITY_DN306_c0_g2_i2.p1 TRINITY_DN306_c0_g2~~TRINITY_DN306_c0_g2_i2.p1  ORF type:complete len:83 (+),score=6.14 TRINITY_DN306_c0_g2_i2:541-789(+)
MKTLQMLHLYVENRQPETVEEFIQYSWNKTVFRKNYMISCDFQQEDMTFFLNTGGVSLVCYIICKTLYNVLQIYSKKSDRNS